MKVEIALFLGFLIGFMPLAQLLKKTFELVMLKNSEFVGESKTLPFAIFVVDVVKGIVAVLIVGSLIEHMGGWAGIGAVAGHCFSTWLKLNDGKGESTALGVLVVLSWPILLVCLSLWAIVAATVRTASIASIATAVAAPIVAWALGTYWVFLCAVLGSIILSQYLSSIYRFIRRI